jgi:DNA replication protein
MKEFGGFPEGKTRFTPVPDLFFSELLASIDDLAELKLLLFLFWSFNRQRGYPRYLTAAELEAEGMLLSALRAETGVDPLVALRDAVEKGVSRGTLLRVSIYPSEKSGGRDEASETPGPVSAVDYLFLNTPQGRKAVEQVRNGELLLETTGYIREAHVAQTHPPIVQLYEQNIGLIPPLLVEELVEAERLYPANWIEEAFKIAVGNNARKWHYIRSILERWASEGKDDGHVASLRRRRSPKSP